MASSSSSLTSPSLLFMLLLLLALSSSSSFLSCCYGFNRFGFDILHRYSDPVKGILPVDDLPEKGSPHYYAAMAHRDTLIHGRKLASSSTTPLTFFYGNQTVQLSSLGFLYYANVSVGTPSLSYLVALDTGSDLFWLPCDCTTTCVHRMNSSSGKEVDFNIYSSSSSSSQNVPCNNTLCPPQPKGQCLSSPTTCPYQIQYLSSNTSSTGLLVQDLLHLITDDSQSKVVDAKIILGCGKVETGLFLKGAAFNGLMGLGKANISVPSTLAREGYTSNSFSMCFGADGFGRISFGDTGSSGQAETPFNSGNSHYNISITNINVDGSGKDFKFTAIFDSGTSFTQLKGSAYSVLTQNFNTLVKDHRYSSSSQNNLPFEFCYEMRSNQTDPEIPLVSLVMEGGSQFNVTDPTVTVLLPNNKNIYCLGVVKSDNINIIGENFMTGYVIVYNLERNVLGWKASDC